MHVIDLEIMIPASPDFIWRFLGDIASSADWQAGVSAVSFLTTQHEGKGARWRYSYARGSDVIVEAAAWYETLGYEYTIVDGSGYGNNQGRIRLQEVNEGTLVRWTFNYEAGGMLGGLRNAMRLKRNTTRQIQDSLRNLHNLVQQESGGISTHAARATVREAPGADERSSYQPRHPSNFVDTASEEVAEDGLAEDLQPIAFALDEEPSPLAGQADGDTKPNPVVLGGNGLLDMELQKNEIAAATEPIDTEVVSIKPEIREARSEEAQLPEAPAEAPAEAISIDRPVPARPSRGAVDTSTLSVFEIFGLKKPSETGEAPAASSGSLLDRESAARDDGVLSERFRDLPLRFDEAEREPPRDRPVYPDAGSGATPEAAAAQAPHVTGMRRMSRRSRRPLRSHN